MDPDWIPEGPQNLHYTLEICIDYQQRKKELKDY